MTISARKITAFQKLVANLADNPPGTMTVPSLKQYFDSSPEELRVALDGLIDDLLNSTLGTSGSENIGSPAITGVTGNTAYAQLLSLKTLLDSHKNAATIDHPAGSIGLVALAQEVKDNLMTLASLNQTYQRKSYADANDYPRIVPEVDDTGRFQRLLDANDIVFISPGTYTVSNLVSCVGKKNIFGIKDESIIKSDINFLQITSGDYSKIFNLRLESISTPYLINRIDANGAWLANPTFGYSTNQGYQLSPNDPEYGANIHTTISPTISFIDSNFVDVFGITGKFITLFFKRCSFCNVHSNDYQAGYNALGGSIIFYGMEDDNITVSKPQIGNKIIGNNTSYSSFCGIFISNFADGFIKNNHNDYCGESGIKTFQKAAGQMYDAYCYNNNISDNFSNYCYYDGFDISQDYPHLDRDTSSYSTVVGNKAKNCKHTGFYCDGKGFIFNNNTAEKCYTSGIYLDINESIIGSNISKNNNQGNNATGYSNITIQGGKNFIFANKAFYDDVIMPNYNMYVVGDENYLICNDCKNRGVLTGGVCFVEGSSNNTTMFANNDSIASKYDIQEPNTTASNIIQKFFIRNTLANPIAAISAILSGGVSGNEAGKYSILTALNGILASGFTVDSVGNVSCDKTTGSFLPPILTTAQRDGMSWVGPGCMIYNSTLSVLQIYSGGAWKTVTMA